MLVAKWLRIVLDQKRCRRYVKKNSFHVLVELNEIKIKLLKCVFSEVSFFHEDTLQYLSDGFHENVSGCQRRGEIQRKMSAKSIYWTAQRSEIIYSCYAVLSLHDPSYIRKHQRSRNLLARVDQTNNGTDVGIAGGFAVALSLDDATLPPTSGIAYIRANGLSFNVVHSLDDHHRRIKPLLLLARLILAGYHG